MRYSETFSGIEVNTSNKGLALGRVALLKVNAKVNSLSIYVDCLLNLAV